MKKIDLNKVNNKVVSEMSKQIHKMLVQLHKVCKVNANFHSYILPKINVEYQEKQKMIGEFDKLINWIAQPYHGHLR